MSAGGELPAYDAFAAVRGELFSIGEDARPARLASVTACQRQSGWECFSLIFELPSDTQMAQSVCRVEHVVLGTMSLLLVPIGPSPEEPAGNVRYEAAFNRRAIA